jgi:hypothetical protein
VKAFKGIPSMMIVLSIAAMAAVALSAAADSGQAAPEGSRDCRIISTEDGGMLQLAASFTAPAALTGEYAFSVTGSGSSGSTQISQGNAFRADKGETLTLGSVSLSPGKVYDVKLRIQSETGESWRCHGTFDF